MGMNEALSDIYDGIYTSIQTWTLSHNSVAALEAPNLRICSNGTSFK